jgi:hypothetical protein
MYVYPSGTVQALQAQDNKHAQEQTTTTYMCPTDLHIRLVARPRAAHARLLLV